MERPDQPDPSFSQQTVAEMLAMQGYTVPEDDLLEITARLNATCHALVALDDQAPFDQEPWPDVTLGVAAPPATLAAMGTRAPATSAAAPAVAPTPADARASDDDVAYLPITEQARMFRSGELTPSELVEIYLRRIERWDGVLNAFITVTADQARAAAAEATAEMGRGHFRSLLHGIPIAFKDQMLIEGTLVTGGSRVLAEHIADRDATVVARLRAAGAIVLGTLNTMEFHSGPTRVYPHGTPLNPWDHGRQPGGSSSGSATAVAAGLCSASLGGDTGGSIRVPAAYNGVVGLKPTWSRVSRDGVIPLAYAMDCVGPLARSVADAALLLQVIAGADPADPTASGLPVPDYTAALAGGLHGLRVGVIEEVMAPGVMSEAAHEATQRMLALLEAEGATLHRISLPVTDETRVVSTALIHSEAAGYHRKWLRTRYLDYDSNTRAGFLSGALLPAGLRSQAERMRMKIAREVMAAMEGVDVLVGPTADVAPRLAPMDAGGGTEGRRDAHQRAGGHVEAAIQALIAPVKAGGPQTRLYSLVGLPAVSLPCGFGESGMPLGLQVAAKHFDEATVLRVAAVVEAAQGRWQPPPLT